jgi:Fe-S oxidoreductase
MNTLKKEYGDHKMNVVHYTQVLSKMILEGRIKPRLPYAKKVIYHDPCFLGKQNGIFDEPRTILQSIEGLELIEFSRNRETSLCCEGGGGRMFYESETSYKRNSEVRVEEALEKGADLIVTACPFCLMTLEDPAKEKELPVKELSELLVEVL